MSALQSTGFLIFWLISAFASAEVANYVLSHDQAAVVLPRGHLHEQLLAALKSIPWQEQELAKEKSLLLTSGQSRTASGGRVLNRVHFFARGHFDIWLMKQEGAGRGLHFHHWNRIAIAVDKSATPAKAYFFEFGREIAGEKGLPTFKAFTAACITCHANGPRLIRPEGNETGAPFTQDQKGLLKNWNQKIQNYRYVQNFRPTWEGRSILDSAASNSREILHLKACEECHSVNSGVRGPLERQHNDSIMYLTTHHEMPLGDHGLSPKAMTCLKAWLDQDAQILKSADCASDGNVATVGFIPWVFDPVHSEARAEATTRLGKIEITDFQLMGTGQCSPAQDCHAHLEIDLKNLKSGIKLRDEHLRELLGSPNISNAEIQFDGQIPFDQTREMPSLLTFHGHQKKVPLVMNCKSELLGPRCSTHFDVDLLEWGIEPPTFLGITVHPRVKVKGTFAFRRRSE